MPSLSTQIANLIQSEVTGGNSSWESMAQLILRLLMSPTDEMIKRGDEVRCNRDPTWTEGNETKSIFRSMIHQAITEGR